MTGLAFLLMIALDFNSTAAARIIGAGLALVVSITAISALGRFRLSEIVDDEMLEKIFEALSNEQMISTMSAHGKSWRKDRQEITVRQQKDSKLLSLEWIANGLGGKRAFNLWIVIFLLTSVCCLFIIGSTFFFPELFG